MLLIWTFANQNVSHHHALAGLIPNDLIKTQDFFRSFLPRLAEIDTDISMFFEVKANLTKFQVAQLRKSGVWSIQPGIESLNSDLLRLMNKGVTALQNIQLLKWCEEFGVHPMWNILYGFPGENASHYIGQDQLVGMLFHLQPPSGAFPIVIERFSPYHFDAGRYGLTIRASQDYSFIYPAEVDLNRIAYFFEEIDGGARAASMEEYTSNLRRSLNEWNAARAQNDIQFYYERGPQAVTLYDNRPTVGGASKSARRLTLTPLQSVIYEHCDQIQSFNSILAMLKSKTLNTLSKEEVKDLLGQFVEGRLMCSEGERYLSLAVRGSKKRRHNRSLWDKESSLQVREPLICKPSSSSLVVLDCKA